MTSERCKPSGRLTDDMDSSMGNGEIGLDEVDMDGYSEEIRLYNVNKNTIEPLNSFSSSLWGNMNDKGSTLKRNNNNNNNNNNNSSIGSGSSSPSYPSPLHTKAETWSYNDAYKPMHVLSSVIKVSTKSTKNRRNAFTAGSSIRQRFGKRKIPTRLSPGIPTIYPDLDSPSSFIGSEDSMRSSSHSKEKFIIPESFFNIRSNDNDISQLQLTTSALSHISINGNNNSVSTTRLLTSSTEESTFNKFQSLRIDADLLGAVASKLCGNSLGSNRSRKGFQFTKMPHYKSHGLRNHQQRLIKGSLSHHNKSRFKMQVDETRSNNKFFIKSNKEIVVDTDDNGTIVLSSAVESYKTDEEIDLSALLSQISINPSKTALSAAQALAEAFSGLALDYKSTN